MYGPVLRAPMRSEMSRVTLNVSASGFDTNGAQQLSCILQHPWWNQSQTLASMLVAAAEPTGP